ncbi:MAG: hypothetical protein IT373_21665 [Polyangiaceae bacterium]|nr:hypothetical protein [Polyangiaceae bacterium]
MRRVARAGLLAGVAGLSLLAAACAGAQSGEQNAWQMPGQLPPPGVPPGAQPLPPPGLPPGAQPLPPPGLPPGAQPLPPPGLPPGAQPSPPPGMPPGVPPLPPPGQPPAPGAQPPAQPPALPAQPTALQPLPVPGQPAPVPTGFDRPVRAGGLEAPPPLDPATMEPPKSPTAARLDQAKADSADRTLEWFWLDVAGGYAFASLAGLHASAEPLTQDFLTDKVHGGFIGAGLGARVLFFTVGPRGRIGLFKDWQLFDIGGELGFHIPVGAIEPYFTFQAGYAALRSTVPELLGVSNPIRVRGADVRFGAGFDGFATSWLSFGAALDWDVLALGRPAVDAGTVAAMQAHANGSDAVSAGKLGADGSSVGTAVTLAAKVGLHF